MQIIAFGFQFDAAHLGQSAQTQVENILRLDVVQVEYGHQPCFGGIRVFGGADDLDHLIDVDQRQQQPLDQMQSLQCLRPAEFAATPDHYT